MNSTMIMQLKSHSWHHFNENIKISKSGIYRIHNQNNNIIYIGQSMNLKDRLVNHFKGHTHTNHFVDEMCFATYMEIESVQLMNYMENSYIWAFKPKYNVKQLSLMESETDSENHDLFQEENIPDAVTSIDEYVNQLERVVQIKPIDLFNDYKKWCTIKGKRFIDKKKSLYKSIEQKFNCRVKNVYLNGKTTKVYVFK
jgi:predicted GIY-YIG superfamily endonuclease